jgi:putative ABC transport system permease protein
LPVPHIYNHVLTIMDTHSTAAFSRIYRYLRVAFRALRRDGQYTVINVVGLTFAIASCVLIFFFVRHDLSADALHEKGDRTALFMLNDGYVRTGGAFGPELQQRLGSIETFTRVVPMDEKLVGEGDRAFYESGFYYADSTFLDVFDYELLEGDRATALDNPMALILTESVARKHFGDQSALGQTLRVDASHTFTVTGVAADPPTTSHLTFRLLASTSSIRRVEGRPLLNSFIYNPAYTYVRFDHRSAMAAAEEDIQSFLVERFGASAPDRTNPSLAALPDLYLRTEAAMPDQLRMPYSIHLVYGLGVVGLMILIMASINYVNLTTARSERRTKEIGVRKSLGANKAQVMGQFLVEAVITAVVAAGFALLLVEYAGPLFQSITGRDLLPALETRLAVYGAVVAVAVGIGVLSGAYPALVLSRFAPIVALKSSSNQGMSRGGLLRKVLVVFQFTAATSLLILAVVIGRQLHFIESADIGFDREQMIVLPLDAPLSTTRFTSLRDALLAQGAVDDVSAASSVPGAVGASGYTITMLPESLRPEGQEEMTSIAELSIAPGFVDALGMELVAGRDVSDSDLATGGAPPVILNESAVDMLGWESAIGRAYPVVTRWTREGPQIEEGRVVGVVKDFNHASLHTSIQPMQMVLRAGQLNNLIVRARSSNVADALSSIQAAWSDLGGTSPVNYYVLSDRFEQHYAEASQTASVQRFFALIAVVIACIGLYGLAAFTIQQRRREIGLRKVLGASEKSILTMVLRDFVLLIAASFVVAGPIAYVLANQWLGDFAYRVPVDAFTFGIAGALLVGITLLTVFWQSVNALRTDPVKVLRSA